MMIIFHTVILIPTCREKDPLFRSNPVIAKPPVIANCRHCEGGIRSNHWSNTFPTEAI